MCHAWQQIHINVISVEIIFLFAKDWVFVLFPDFTGKNTRNAVKMKRWANSYPLMKSFLKSAEFQ